MNILKKIHYFWTGNNIPENDLRNIMTMKHENPGFEVNIWSKNGDNTLILNTLRSLTFKFKQQNVNIGEIMINENLFNYRNIEEAFTRLIQRTNIIYQSRIKYYKQNNNYNRNIEFNCFKQNIKRYGDYSELINYLHHVYHLHLHGDHHNYAAASDIARLVILYLEGGIYLDADVQLTDSHMKYRKSEVFDKFIYSQEGEPLRKDINGKTARFEKADFPPGLGFGDTSGRGWRKVSEEEKWNTIRKENISDDHKIGSYTSTILGNRFGNAIISAPQYSTTIFNILLKMATEMKRKHLKLQIDQTQKADKINAIKYPLQPYQDNLRIDKALKYHKAGKISLDKRCSMLDPIWRTGIDASRPTNENTPTDIRHRRIDKTVEMTGPAVYARFLNLHNDNYLSEDHQIKGRRSLLFKETDAGGVWAAVNIHKKKK
ncbi:hypothetical protein Xbed_02099 [Xenorhabdus beddingii]|uniref:Uncharacterized protein n=1 Tax=Xenorhabdus beddingii TaxID=40578 RepID=A0A1Y2SLX1_9GAMM|nr:glycosyltransferase [Xenorhabdus beddingii]OTA19788.1 hypothetical protein Xbed_02099 [Xenorhabdus beddingii]